MDASDLLLLARRKQSLTQAELARRAGTSQPVISAYEHRRRDPSIATLRRLVAATGERLALGLERRETPIPAPQTPQERSERLVDVLLLADAVPTRPPATGVEFPRIDSR